MSKYLNQNIVEELLKVKSDGILYHRESQLLEFKESFNFAGLADYFRDFSAFANNKGGYLLFGIKDRPRRELVGLSQKAKEQFDKLDPAIISGYLLDIFSSIMEWENDIFQINDLWFAVFYVYEAEEKPIICKKDEGREKVLKNGEIYFRYGGRTPKIQFGELELIIKKRIEQNNLQWLDLVQKIGKSGPQNAAILDTEKGLIEKEKSQILVIDEKLAKEIQWIKTGEFSETKGEKTLKLVGEVQPMNSVEVVKRVKENRLREYPLSFRQLETKVNKAITTIKQNELHTIIRENNIKENKEYSTYSFRNKQQEDNYEKKGVIATGTSSIYKTNTIDLIVRIYKNEYDKK